MRDIAAGLAAFGGISAEQLDRAATAYLALAERDGFPLGMGALRISFLAARHGVGFMRDRQHPQLAALFRDDIRADEAWRLSLLGQWEVYAQGRAGAFSPERTRVGLKKLADLVHSYGADYLSADPATVFHAIGPAKAGLYAPHVWRDIAAAWPGDFVRELHFAGAPQMHRVTLEIVTVIAVPMSASLPRS